MVGAPSADITSGLIVFHLQMDLCVLYEASKIADHLSVVTGTEIWTMRNTPKFMNINPLRLTAIPRLLASAIMLAAVATPMALAGELEVTPDPENVVANRLEGLWQINDAISDDLGSLPRCFESVEFRGDSAIVTEIPSEYGEIFDDSTIYLAGTVTLTAEGETTPAFPFLLTEMHGTPAILIFVPIDGLPLGRYEVIFVMLAAAADSSNDLLFIGCDYNDQPPTAYDRISVTQP
ncbi:MAG: hypothetical protein RIB93_31730 [Coleofasciculus sp. D1-CHI-01]|uniref:hypothetical protein n=1 Tax=Coleofasciculus sp. D1-CHI-01 TaxID=3068482 RepID=UPI0033000E76